VFDDGPRQGVAGASGQRYCMNSAALRFIPTPELAAAGYGLYAGLF
jgi:peptide-methionine (R)-S-oxide reductase